MIDKLKKREVEFHLRNKRDEGRVKKDLMRRSRLRPDQIRMPDMRLTEEQMRKMGGLAQRLVARLSWVDALVVALKVERPVERRGSYKAVKKWLDSLSGDRAALAERVLAELPK